MALFGAIGTEQGNILERVTMPTSTPDEPLAQVIVF